MTITETMPSPELVEDAKRCRVSDPFAFPLADLLRFICRKNARLGAQVLAREFQLTDCPPLSWREAWQFGVDGSLSFYFDRCDHDAYGPTDAARAFVTRLLGPDYELDARI
jgi:hypothetical protein